MQLYFCHLSPGGPINLQLCHTDNGSEDSAAGVIFQPWHKTETDNCKTKGLVWKTQHLHPYNEWDSVLLAEFFWFYVTCFKIFKISISQSRTLNFYYQNAPWQRLKTFLVYGRVLTASCRGPVCFAASLLSASICSNNWPSCPTFLLAGSFKYATGKWISETWWGLKAAHEACMTLCLLWNGLNLLPSERRCHIM